MPAPAVEVQDRYHLLGLLGEGGFGQVYEAWDALLCRRIAVKRLKARPAGDRPDRLVREARFGASLKHACFVKVHSVEGDGPLQSIIMELVQGVTLSQLTRQHALGVALALDIVRQVAEAMEEAHAARLIHGDIKPSNLMLDTSGRARILDFGQACHAGLPGVGQFGYDEASGTVAYLAPERLWGERPSEQSDVYSLGAVLYELIVGKRPFAELKGLALAAAHVQSSSACWPFPAQIPRPVAALVRALTARDLGQRLPSMRAVRDSIHCGPWPDRLAGSGH